MNEENEGMKPESACRVYFAPMEGITGHIYRMAHAGHFPGVDRYYMPFVAVHSSHSMKNKEKKDIDPANNAGLYAVPQLLTKNADDFIWAVDEMRARGYDEINLNFGCPSPTVTSKGKGAAFLGDPDGMDRFFDAAFEGLERCGVTVIALSGSGSGKTGQDGVRISVKTRIGVESTDEWKDIFAVYNRYPFSELHVHVRTMREFYQGAVHPEVFAEILRQSRIPVCYNGDIYTLQDYRAIEERFGGKKNFSGVMIGRGLIGNPALIREIGGGKRLRAEELCAFHDEVLAGYQRELSGDTHVISKMKELWWYMSTLLPDGKKVLKRIRKARTVREYRSAVREAVGMYATLP